MPTLISIQTRRKKVCDLFRVALMRGLLQTTAEAFEQYLARVLDAVAQRVDASANRGRGDSVPITAATNWAHEQSVPSVSIASKCG